MTANKQFSVYCAHPISGLTWEQVTQYYNDIKAKLTAFGFHVLQPMTGKSDIRANVLANKEFASTGGYGGSPLATDNAIFQRDSFMCRCADMLYLDLTGATRISIGCVMELAIAATSAKPVHVVVVMEDGNPHEHAFVNGAAHIIFRTVDEALAYMAKFARQEM